MNPNFQKQQLTDEFIQAARANPTQGGSDAYQKSQFKQVDENTTTRWDAVLSLGPKHLREKAGLTGLIAPYLIVSLMGGELMPLSEGWFMVVAGIFIGFMSWLHFAEMCYYYRFGDQAMAMHQHQNQPHSAYTALRGLAWVGVVFCIVITIWVGPMAFVGAGASALMAFKMIDAKRFDMYWIIPYDSVLVIDVIRKDNYIAIWFKDVDFELGTESPQIFENITIYGLFCKPEQFDDILATLKSKLHSEVQFFESPSVDKKINFFEESKKYDISLISVPLHEEVQQKNEFDSTEDSW
ncbi:hypothetical protein [Vibrio scophthalmi]|uniref:Uncharacterized protein n=1 Tax=Vibrio scophthalmi LMG 19158 TaxID=870967 RepID=F9RT97_9VIBR|nr:hypothetical protein [Vibrio scophthalmi]EGU31335.1 hypothetical protein VIS19158_14557 [Vibrio scophthalmi LMG 19158]